MIKVAVIGVGNMGRHHARNYSEMDKVDLSAISDLHQKTGQEYSKKYNCKYYKNYKELIEIEKPRAVSIAVPTKFHSEVANYCLDKNISILLEKPIASNSKEAEKLIKKANSKKIVFMIGHIERFNPAVLKLKSLVDEKFFGDIVSILIRRVGIFPPQVTDVNVVTDIGVHDLDIISNLLESMPNSIYSKGSGILTKGQEDHAEIFLDYGNFGCFLQTNWITPIKIRTLSLTGTKGHAELDFISQKLKVYRSYYDIEPIEKFDQFVAKFSKPEIKSIYVKKQEPLRAEIEEFLNAISEGRKPRVTAEDGLRALKLAELVNKSIHTGNVVKIND